MAIEVDDDFTEASNTVLTSHTSSPTGGEVWVEEINTSIQIAQVFAAADQVGMDADDSNQKVLYTARPNPSGSEYDITYTILVRDSSNDDTHWIVARYSDADTFYAVGGADASGAGVAIDLLEKNGATATILASAAEDFGVTTYTFEMRDASKRLLDGVTEKINYTADNNITAAGSCGLGWGHIGVNSGFTQDATANWKGDDFIVDVIAAPAGGGVWPSPTKQMAHLINR